jgi:hypothetical protein
MNQKNQFLKAVLGDDGAQALRKAAERSDTLENALIPRTILAWIGIAARSSYSGALPGIENTYVEFTKSENGYSGQIAIGDDVYEFKDKNVYHLTASVAVSMGVDHERVPANLKDSDVARLGKSIDLLVKARVVTEQLLKKAVAGAEAPGPAAKPTPAADPIAPDAPTAQQAALPKPTKAKPKLPRTSSKATSVPMLPKLKLSEAQLQKKCTACSSGHLRNGKFIGCMCWRDLAKSTTLVKNGDGSFTMSFGKDWDQDAVETFVADMRLKR